MHENQVMPLIWRGSGRCSHLNREELSQDWLNVEEHAVCQKRLQLGLFENYTPFQKLRDPMQLEFRCSSAEEISEMMYLITYGRHQLCSWLSILATAANRNDR